MGAFKFNVGDKFKILVGEDQVVAEVINREVAFKRYNLYELKVDFGDERPIYRMFNEFQVVKFERA